MKTNKVQAISKKPISHKFDKIEAWKTQSMAFWIQNFYDRM